MTLSGGEQQMLAIARALARDIKVLLLDEPYEGLAPVIVDEIEKTLRIIKEQGITTIIVEQNAVRALELADRAVILDTGGDRLRRHGRRGAGQRGAARRIPGDLTAPIPPATMPRSAAGQSPMSVEEEPP